MLARHGLSPKRSFSQNFLCSPKAVDAIARATGAEPGVTVVELGPGCGTLTAALLELGASVLAIERDRDMIALLAEELPTSALSVRQGDAATVDYAQLATELGEVRVVGNLPYAITGAILRGLIDGCEHIERAVVMVQREVGERLRAAPGSSAYGGLSVFAQNVYAIERVLKVPASAFHPAPKVDSAVMHLVPHAKPRATPDDVFAKLVHAAFQGRRKTLRNCLRRLPDATPERVAAALANADVADGERGERLSAERFGLLADAWRAQAGDDP